MIKIIRLGLAVLFGAAIIATTLHLSQPAQTTATVDAQDWVHLSSKGGDLPVPSESDQQTASLVLDVDQDGLSDFVIGARAGAGPGLVPTPSRRLGPPCGRDAVIGPGRRFGASVRSGCPPR